jgi:hypothetical protein
MGDVKRISQGNRHMVIMLTGSTDMEIDIK